MKIARTAPRQPVKTSNWWCRMSRPRTCKDMKTTLLSVLALAASVLAAQAIDFGGVPLFHSSNSLAQRDEYGLLHQSAVLGETDMAHRWKVRELYYLQSGRELVADPAYMGAVQVALSRRGYYCGPADGVWSAEVSDAIARMQKNNSMYVTGTLTVPVRRSLHLP